MNLIDEKRLIHAAKQEDRDTFATLYQANSDRIYRYIYRRVNHVQLTEDLTSDVFLQPKVCAKAAIAAPLRETPVIW